MAELPDFTKLVPGFEFLQGLVKNAGAAMPAVPGMSQWIAPTLDPEELEKRIGELKTVQFWLEQNARLLGTTIQAMEVQRMTLSTLQTMNVKMDDLRESMTAKVPSATSAFTSGAAGFPAAFANAFKFPAAVGKTADSNESSQEPSDGASAVPNPFITPKRSAPEAKHADDLSTSTAAAAPGAAEPAADEAGASRAPAVDPMKWWGALTEQFATLAATAIKDGTTEAQRAMAGITAAATKAARPPRASRSAGSETSGASSTKQSSGGSTAKRGDVQGQPKPGALGASRPGTKAPAKSPAKTARGAASGTMRATGSAAKTAQAASPSSRRTTSR